MQTRQHHDCLYNMNMLSREENAHMTFYIRNKVTFTIFKSLYTTIAVT